MSLASMSIASIQQNTSTDRHSVGSGAPSEDSWERHNVMVSYLYGRILSNRWLSNTRTPADTPTSSIYNFSCGGILLRQSRGAYVSQPVGLAPELLAAVQKLNVEVAFTMSTEITDLIFSLLAPGQTELVLGLGGSQYQILDSLEEIAKSTSSKVKRFQYACFVQREKVLLLWHDDVERILVHAAEVERTLLTVVWGSRIPNLPPQAYVLPSTAHTSLVASPQASMDKLPHYPTLMNGPTVVEKQMAGEESLVPNLESLDRPLVFISAIFVGLAIGLIVVLLLGFGTSELIYQSLVDGKWLRMALIATTPFFGLFGLFFVIVIFTDIFQVFGPVGAVLSNSRSYSAIRPNIQLAYKAGFTCPHVTIEMPVYKESLTSVIMPTVTSLKAAISHYELNGGTANIFIFDDGLQILSEQEADARRAFYSENSIGWVARPKHGVDGFVRGGKFKKASNMNYGLNVSNRTEDRLQSIIEEKVRTEATTAVSQEEEDVAYRSALDQVLKDDGRAWADGNIRVGEFILIVDSDTRVPVDCLIYGAAEMFLSPEVAIVQHSAGVMQIVGDYFENGITFFTNQIYTAISFAVSSGEAAPFVGHNAFIRWQVVQSVASKAADGSDLFWSEEHVSEDFDISLRVQMAGNVVRLATYHGNGFKEGVSLTVYDELSRWEKYAYGCNELVFNPIHKWLWKSPFTPLFRKLLWSNMQLSSKFTILGYIATYYALAFGLPLTLLNYLLVGWYNGYLDKFYMESWKIFVGLVVVFSGLGNVCLAVLRYRLGEKTLIAALIENFKWMPMFAIFFGGMSFHLFLALFAHMFSIKMEWGATAKEAEASNFFKEVPKIFKSFKWMYIFVAICIVGMIYLGCFAPKGWQINGVTATLPMAVMLGSHVLLPFALNPSLMVFNY